MSSMNQTQVTTNMLASFSEMLTTLIDQRLAILATRNETPLTEVIDRRITAARMQSDARRDEALGNLIDMKLKQRSTGPISLDAIDTKIKTLMNEHLLGMLRDAIRDEMTKDREDGSLLEREVGETVANILDDALDTWMSDTANTDRLMKSIDVDEVFLEAIVGKTLQVTFG